MFPAATNSFSNKEPDCGNSINCPIAFSMLSKNAEAAVGFLIGTIHNADITASEHIAVTVGYTGIRTNLTAVYAHFSLTEHETVIMK